MTDITRWPYSSRKHKTVHHMTCQSTNEAGGCGRPLPVCFDAAFVILHGFCTVLSASIQLYSLKREASPMSSIRRVHPTAMYDTVTTCQTQDLCGLFCLAVGFTLQGRLGFTHPEHQLHFLSGASVLRPSPKTFLFRSLDGHLDPGVLDSHGCVPNGILFPI